MRVPKNKILDNQYTAGNEFIRYYDKSEYIGYYHVIGGTQYFTGLAGSSDSLRIDKIENVEVNNTPINGKSSVLSSGDIISIQWKPNEWDIINGYADRYFVKKINSNPILIKEVSKETYEAVKDKIMYQRINIIWMLYGENKEYLWEGMVGLKEFLLG